MYIENSKKNIVSPCFELTYTYQIMFFPIIKIFNYCEYLSFCTFACINVPCIVELCPISAERKQYSQQLFLLFPIILYSKLKKASTVDAFLNIFHFHIGNFFFRRMNKYFAQNVLFRNNTERHL